VAEAAPANRHFAAPTMTRIAPHSHPSALHLFNEPVRGTIIIRAPSSSTTPRMPTRAALASDCLGRRDLADAAPGHALVRPLGINRVWRRTRLLRAHRGSSSGGRPWPQTPSRGSTRSSRAASFERRRPLVFAGSAGVCVTMAWWRDRFVEKMRCGRAPSWAMQRAIQCKFAQKGVASAEGRSASRDTLEGTKGRKRGGGAEGKRG
jgi:hypothetical protein